VVSQIDILQRRARRLDKIANRLELVEGYIIAYLNLDRVIEIIRTEDEPKPMMAEFGLTDRQAEAILNMRLRACASWRRWSCAVSGTICSKSRTS
jgi:topoisomerase-4 subunit A